MNTEPNATNILYENSNYLVTEEGELFQKDTSLFKGRKLGTVDPQNLDKELEPYHRAFDQLKQQVSGKLDEIKSLKNPEEISQQFDSLLDQVQKAEAIGDFPELIQAIQNKQKELLNAAEKEETPSQNEPEEDAVSPDEEGQDQKIEATAGNSDITEGKAEASKADTTDKESVSDEADTASQESKKTPVEEDSEVTTAESSDETEEETEDTSDEEQVSSESETKAIATEDTTEKESASDEADTASQESKKIPVEKDSEVTTAESSDETEEEIEETSDEEQVSSESETEATATEEDDTAEKNESEPVAEEKQENQDLNLDFEVPEALSAYYEIVDKAHSLLHRSDITYANMEFDNLRRKWSEGPEVDEEQKEIYDKLNEVFDAQQKEFQDRKSAHYNEIQQKKIKNLERKNDLLSRLQSIINQKKWHALNEVQGIEKRWDNIRLIDSHEAEPLDRQYRTLIEEFEKNRVEYLVARKEKEEQNLTLKLTILDKISNILNSIDENFSDWDALDKDYNELLREWKKVGRVPREKASNVWQRYKDLRSTYYDKKLTYDTSYRNEVESRYSKKQNLVKEAQKLVDAEDLAQAARSINKLHKRWKDVGALPKEQSEELWSQFKAATDAFNERKAENIDLLREQENENYESKVKLCEEAEAVKDTDNWKEGTRRMQQLMDQWKAIGPVPRRKTRKIWRRFKKSMDHFYDRKREYFKEERQRQKENLKKKREIIDQIFKLGEHEDPIEARNQVKPLQKAFSDIGFVPIKQKNKIYKQYREACDVVYQRARAADRGEPVPGKQAVLSHDDRRELRDKHNLINKLRKECDKLNELILSYSDSQTFIRPNKQGLQLREEIQAKIDKAKDELERKQEKMEELRQEIDEIRSGESS